jgi:Tol biopolymer transport system component
MLAFTRGVRGPDNYGIQENEMTDIYVMRLSGGEPKQLTFDRANTGGLAWTPDNREIVYISNRARTGEEMSYYRGRLWRVPAAGGEPELLTLNVDWHSFPAIAPNGGRLAYAELKQQRWSVWRYEIPASPEQVTPPTELAFSSEGEFGGEYSPDGQKIVFASYRSGSDEIWVWDSDGRNPVQLTFLRGPRTGSPRWAPDGRFIAFDSWRDGHADVYTISAEGGEVQKLTTGPQWSAVPSWSRDGRWIYFGSGRSDESEIWKIPEHSRFGDLADSGFLTFS